MSILCHGIKERDHNFYVNHSMYKIKKLATADLSIFPENYIFQSMNQFSLEIIFNRKKKLKKIDHFRFQNLKKKLILQVYLHG